MNRKETSSSLNPIPFLDTRSLLMFSFVIGLFILLLGPKLLSHGMFMDGLIYASISRNLAQGLGSLWNPHFTDTVLAGFHEHLPFGLFLQSLFFRIFGDHIFVEKLYSFLTAVATGYLISRIFWKSSGSRPAHLLWLPLLYWILVPLVSWSYANNMLENSMGVFTTLSILMMLRGLDGKRWLFLSAASLCLYTGFFIKNFPSLFPLVFPAFHWLVFRKVSWKRALVDTIFLVFLTGGLAAATFAFYPGAWDGFLTFVRLKISSNVKPSLDLQRFSILWRCITELSPALVIAGVFFIVDRLWKHRPETGKGSDRKGLFFLLMGLSGVVPLVLTGKQAGYYMLAAFPMFALSLGFFSLPPVDRILHKIKTVTLTFRIFFVLSIVLLASSLVFSFSKIGTFNRDGETIRDIQKIVSMAPAGSRMSLCPDLRTAWHLHGYFARYGMISLDWERFTCDYGISEGYCGPDWERHFIRSGLKLEKLVLFVNREKSEGR